MNKRAVTLYDVAREAGVSYQTVSRVINHSANVSNATRQRVFNAIKQLHYVPNKVAQQLAGKLSQTIGLATTSLALHAPSQIAAAVKARASAERYHTVIAMVDNSHPQAVHDAVKQLQAQRVDGIIVNIPLSDTLASATRQLGPQLPMLFNDVSPTCQENYVIFDPSLGSHLTIERLVSLGHREIVLLTGPQDSISAALRADSACKQLRTHQLAPVLTVAGDWSAKSGFDAMTYAMLQKKRFTAVVVANDQMALGALRALTEAGFSVPEEVSVTGYDDTSDSAFFSPPLTTIRQNFSLLGQESVEQLLTLIAGGSACQRVLPVSLIERETVAAVQASQPSAQQLARQLKKVALQLEQLSQ
ncbi:LacI family DNA-binding transcriptional regulator [Rosenbergiella nectarea]|uniref:LacI family DNA-binding transcriptional regulator n=1 Tax=Rosenbergiella nectarea TaxID=988801 RepID=UPI001F4E8A01|nr:LacI family DNA-binding transcriptional regulator [Rosenbergiella nectarea]